VERQRGNFFVRQGGGIGLPGVAGIAAGIDALVGAENDLIGVAWVNEYFLNLVRWVKRITQGTPRIAPIGADGQAGFIAPSEAGAVQ